MGVRFRFPRRRGDGPEYHGLPSWSFRCNRVSPAGAGMDHRVQSFLSAVSPAGAGMDRCLHEHTIARPGFPRRRGDGPWWAADWWAATFPPQARGWRRTCSPFPPQARGWTLESTSDASTPEWFPPQARGWTVLCKTHQGTPQAFPPQARGWTFTWCFPFSCLSWVSPAGAGMDRCRSS